MTTQDPRNCQFLFPWGWNNKEFPVWISCILCFSLQRASRGSSWNLCRSFLGRRTTLIKLYLGGWIVFVEKDRHGYVLYPSIGNRDFIGSHKCFYSFVDNVTFAFKLIEFYLFFSSIFLDDFWKEGGHKLFIHKLSFSQCMKIYSTKLCYNLKHIRE